MAELTTLTKDSMENSYLKKLQKSLPYFFTYFKADNILMVSDSNLEAPFAFVVSGSKDEPLLLSVSVDYPRNDHIVEVAITCAQIKNTVPAESFYFSKTGATHVGDDAFKYHHMDVELPIELLEPVSELKH